MSKLYNIYLQEKVKNKDLILLFKSGIFYIALDEDATMLSNLFYLKLTDLNSSVKKCGFPCSSIDKYLTLFKYSNLYIKIIDSNTTTSYSINQFSQNQIITTLIEKIKNVDTNYLSISDSYTFIEDLKEIIKSNNL